MPGDAEFLRTYAVRGEANAEVVAEAITSRDDGFWELASEMIDRHPNNESLKSKLEFAISQDGLGIAGSYADHQIAIAQAIEQARDSLGDRYPRARMWFDRLAPAFRAAAKGTRRQEDDRWIDD
jgi:hypothetical protein